MSRVAVSSRSVRSADTIWESWEGTEAQGGVASLDHYSKGAVCEWIFDTMCGVKVVGERTFRIAPKIGGHVTHAECAYESAYGRVESKWKREGGVAEYHVKVPANTTAEVILPDGARTVTAGEYAFSVTL